MQLKGKNQKQRLLPKQLKSALGADPERMWRHIELGAPLLQIISGAYTGNNVCAGNAINSEIFRFTIENFGQPFPIPVARCARKGDKSIIYESITDVGDLILFAMRANKNKSADIQVFDGAEKEIAMLRLSMLHLVPHTAADIISYIKKRLLRLRVGDATIAEAMSVSSETAKDYMDLSRYGSDFVIKMLGRGVIDTQWAGAMIRETRSDHAKQKAKVEAKIAPPQKEPTKKLKLRKRKKRATKGAV